MWRHIAAGRRQRDEETGAQILLECLKREGVEVIFITPGGAILPVNDELYRWDFTVVLSGMSRGGACRRRYARASGKVGVCLVTSRGRVRTTRSPAWPRRILDSIPIVVITGQVSTP